MDDVEDDDDVAQYTVSATPVLRTRQRSVVSSNPADPNLLNPFQYLTSGGPSSSADSSPRTPTAAGEESLLFNESGYGLGGMLPGLEEPTPMSLATGAIPPKYETEMAPGKGTGMVLGRGPPSKPTKAPLPGVETDATRAAARRVKEERDRDRQRRASVTKTLKPLTAREGSGLK
jgi:hypothetical protein